MTKLKIAVLAVLLASAGKLPAPPSPGQGIQCSDIVDIWTMPSPSLVANGTAWLFTLNTPKDGLVKIKAYRDGVFYFETPYASFGIPASYHGKWTFKCFSVAECNKSFGPFTL